jgi:hypothetical protein
MVKIERVATQAGGFKKRPEPPIKEIQASSYQKRSKDELAARVAQDIMTVPM